MTLLEAIEQRHSVRRYVGKSLSSEITTALQTKIDECNQRGRLNIQLVTNEKRAFTGMFAYGKFSGVENYIVMVGREDGYIAEGHLTSLDERVGYYGEQLVLLAQQLGLNTCWVGLSYRKTDAYNIAKGEKLACMIALGYGETQGVQHPEKKHHIDTDAPEWYQKGYETALLAPTAINQQKYSFEYIPATEGELPKVKANRGFSMVGYTQMDMGIAKLHFEIGASAWAGKETQEIFSWLKE